MRPEDMPLPPPPAEPDRHYLRADPRADRPDTVESPNTSSFPPVLFFQHVEGVKEGYEETEKFLRLQNNALWETDIERRLAALEEALACAERIKSDPNAADVLDLSLGVLYGNLGSTILHRRTHTYRENKEEALKYFALAIAHFERKGEIDNIAKTHYNIAVSLSQGMSSDDFADIALCLSHLREALRLYQSTEVGWIPPEVRLNFAALALRSRGSRRAENIAEAIRLLGPLTTPSSRARSAELWASAQNSLANLLFATEGRHRRASWLAAIEATKRALEVRTRSEMPDQWAVSTLNLIEMSAAYAEVFQDPATAFDLTPYRELIDYWMTTGRKIRVASTLRTLARRLLLSAFQSSGADRERLLGEAREPLQQAMEVFSPDASADQFVETAMLLFRVLLMQRSFEEAASLGLTILRVSQSLEEAGAELERIQSVSSRVRAVGSTAAFLYALGGDVANALECVEIGRARFLRASLHLGRAEDGHDQEVLALRGRMRDLEREIRASQGDAGLEKTEQFNQLRRAFLQKLVGRPGGIGVPPLAHLETILTNYDALVWLVFCGIGACLIVATPGSGSGGPSLFAEPLEVPPLDIDDSVTNSWARESVVASALNPSDESGAAQWRSTIGNIGERLWIGVFQHVARVLYERGIRSGRIVLLPPGELAILPLGLACDPATRTPLLEQFEVSIAPTLSALTPSPGRGRRPWTLGAVINPTLDLPFTVIEAARSIQAFPAGRCALVSAAESTFAATQNALDGKTHWLLSTHGTFEPADPRQSRIQLAEGRALTLDGLLSTDRAAAPRLVILSACETGLQDLSSAPDEFVGFPTAFLQLGAGGVIASLWRVNDASTALLIARFIAYHVEGGLRPAAALRRAQLWLRDATMAQIRKDLSELQVGLARVTGGSDITAQIDLLFADLPRTGKPFQHPYYWGGFAMFGR